MALRKTLDRIRSNPDPLNNIGVLAEIILPILRDLGWETADPNEVHYKCIKDEPSNKKISIAFKQQYGISVLTNGLEWWLRLLPEQGVNQDRVFATIIVKKDPIKQVIYNLETFLNKNDVMNGQSRQKARGILEARKEAILLAKELPSIWQSMLSQPDSKLVDLLLERTHEKLEIYPRKLLVKAILNATNLEKLRQGIPSSIRLRGRKYDVEPWRYENMLLVKVAEILCELYGQEFLDRLLTAKATGTGNPYASHNADDLRLATKVWADVYLETDLNAAQTRRRTEQIMELMGLSPSDLEYLYD